MNLYELNTAYKQAMQEAENQAFENEGEITEELSTIIDNIEIDRQDKIGNTALYYKNLSAFIDSLKQEENELKNRRKKLESKAESLLGWLKFCLDGENIKDVKYEIKFNTSESLVIDNIDKIPESEKEKVIDWKVDKNGLKKKIKGGAIIDGVHIQKNLNIKVK